MTDDARFRNAGRYAGTQGFVGGFANFHEADYGRGVVYGTLLLPATTVEWRDVPRAELRALVPAAEISNVAALVRAVNRWGSAHGYDGGIPTFEQADHGAGVVYGVLLLRPGVTAWRDVPHAVVGANRIDDVPRMMRGANDYAVSQGFATGIPTFEEADHGAGVVYGVRLFPEGTISWRDVYADVLKMQSNYSFAAGFTDGERTTIMERWALAYERFRDCGTLSDADKRKITRAFRRKIDHTLDAPANANASAPINGSTININRTNFFDLIPRERAQTLLHEMCHLAGFAHPDRRDCPPGTPPACDVPGDNGQYYGTVPLQAELCIAGVQSDTVCAPTPEGMSPQHPSSPRIASIDYNPPGADVDRERVRLIHDGAAPVQLQGWTLRDAAGHTYTFPQFILSPGGTAWVWTGIGRDDSENLYWGRRKAVWNNTGDTATLSDALGAVIHSYSYR